NLLYTQESLSRYQSGGYHPVNLGDTFEDDRYKIHHKLGWGGFSTVWLAKDRERLISRQSQSMGLFEDHDRRFIGIARAANERISSNYVIQLLDAFTHEGPKGVHHCLVTELLGPSVDKVLSDYHESHDKICSEIILRMSTQLLKAVKFIHSAVPLYLCANISGRNIAFGCTHLWRKTEEQLFDVLGFPEVEPLTRVDGTPLGTGLPTQLIKAAD
ncbi:uncharacterized protein N7477_000855, partial [Penicillium maclennaniae]|uniref:uncharacterized protein n=1 Tax=Penicillium maclennaniae TaxID=1343394 RepID=UPI0025419D52